MNEVLFDIYNDAYYAAVNSGACESDAIYYATQCCKDLQNQISMFDL